MYSCSEFEVILIRTDKNTEHTKMQKIIKYISTCYHLHMDRYDTMNHCIKFEVILMRT